MIKQLLKIIIKAIQLILLTGTLTFRDWRIGYLQWTPFYNLLVVN